MSDIYGVSRKRLLGETWFWIAAVIAALVVFTLLGLGWRYVIAGPSGAVGAREQQQSANTRVQKQEMFEQLAADFDGDLIKINVAKDAWREAKASGNKVDAELRATELVGLRQICIDRAQQFNAESRKYTARVWKSAGLPANLDATLCQ